MGPYQHASRGATVDSEKSYLGSHGVGEEGGRRKRRRKRSRNARRKGTTRSAGALDRQQKAKHRARARARGERASRRQAMSAEHTQALDERKEREQSVESEQAGVKQRRELKRETGIGGARAVAELVAKVVVQLWWRLGRRACRQGESEKGRQKSTCPLLGPLGAKYGAVVPASTSCSNHSSGLCAPRESSPLVPGRRPRLPDELVPRSPAATVPGGGFILFYFFFLFYKPVGRNTWMLYSYIRICTVSRYTHTSGAV